MSWKQRKVEFNDLNSEYMPHTPEHHLLSRRRLITGGVVFALLRYDTSRKLIFDLVGTSAKNEKSESANALGPGTTALLQTVNTEPLPPTQTEMQMLYRQYSTMPPELVTGVFDRWALNPDYLSIVNNNKKLSQPQKDYLLFVIKGVRLIQSRGGLVNPRVMTAQSALETGYGIDRVSKKLNFFGLKAPKNDPNSAILPTHEDYGNGLVPTPGNFKTFDGQEITEDVVFSSFYVYADNMISNQNLLDATPCRYDNLTDLHGLQDLVSPDRCEVILKQGDFLNGKDGDRVLGYATAKNYIDVGLDVIDSLNLNDIFLLQG